MNTSQLYNIYLTHPNITTDSRQIEAGCIFFALKGERFNGNKYAKNAIEQGASYVVIDEAEYKEGEQFILVSDVLETLQALANHHRRQLNIPFIGITGSNGKTTTKELVSKVLATSFKTAYTKGNFNNHIGVPLTILEIPLDTEIAVIEMGANHQGEIALLCSIAEPTHGIINNIGKAHLEGFGGIEGIKKGKSELYEFLAKNNGFAFVNVDLPHLILLMKERNVQNFHLYGQDISLEYETTLIKSEPFVSLKLGNISRRKTTIHSHLIGEYNFHNILSAIAIGKYFKIPHAKIKRAIERYIPSNNRSQIVIKDTNTFILDAYNANPTSTQHALEHFSKIKTDKKIVILGDMLELGEASKSEHEEISQLAERLKFDSIILVGNEYKKVHEKVNCQHFDNVNVLKEWFEQQTFTNTHFLIKGSRGIRLEKLLS